MKSYTDLEQSKKLAEFLPLDSADMCYPRDAFAFHYDKEPVCHYTGIGLSHPCWSLTGLLEIVKKQGPLPYKNGLVFPCIEIIPQCSVEYSNANGDVAYYCEADNLVDACYEMIVKLHEQKLL